MQDDQHVVGRTKDAGFQVGARRTFDIGREVAWNLLTSDAAIRVWLGDVTNLRLQPGATYTTADGATGEVRVVKPGSHIRLTWQPPGWQRASTIQVRVIPSGGKTAVSLHQEQLAGPRERAEMQRRWYGVLDELAAIIEREYAPGDRER